MAQGLYAANPHVQTTLSEVTTVMTARTYSLKNPTSSQGTLILGTGLAFASLILLPAVAARFGINAALTGAMRIALMKASSRVVSATQANGEAAPVSMSCH